MVFMILYFQSGKWYHIKVNNETISGQTGNYGIILTLQKENPHIIVGVSVFGKNIKPIQQLQQLIVKK